MPQILLVDDVLLNRKVVKVALGGLPNMTFLEATDGVNALEVIHSQPIALVILDLVMPGNVTGFDILREVKASVLYKHIPVIVYSAIADTASIKQALELGAHDYLVKPLKPQELQSVLPEKVRDALKNSENSKDSQSTSQQAPATAASRPEKLSIGKVSKEEAAAIKYLTNRKTELKQQLKRLIDMDKEELYCVLYDKIIQEMGEVSTACEQWWDTKFDKYQWDNIVGEEIEIDYDNGQVFVKQRSAAVRRPEPDEQENPE